MVTVVLLGGCQPALEDVGPASAARPGAIAAVCDHQAPGPSVPPAGAVVVNPAVDNDLADKTKDNPPGTTFWLAPGTHTLGTDQFGQVAPKDGNRYIGAPHAVVDGRGFNMYAFVAKASNVTISDLTVRGFIPPVDQGVVNHDSGDGWVITNNTFENNKGAALMAGYGQRVLHNCLRNNGQYGMNAFGGNLVVVGNEIVGNNTDDLEHTLPGGCGCTGGVKFWDVNKADVRNNWVHDNHGPGLWADTNDNDFLVENNLIENNEGEAFIYEISYNLILRNNIIRNNTFGMGRQFVDRNDNFPVGTIYISESGGEPRVPARTDKIEIYGNTLENNWSGITAWENADRFCNSAANTSTGYCTRLVSSPAACAPPAIDTPPLFNDCRWKTQRLDIHDNTFIYSPRVIGCSHGLAGRMAIFANYGTVPAWSPYKARTVQDAITYHQDNIWHHNTYYGPWAFVTYETGPGTPPATWRAQPNGQDTDSTFIDNSPRPSC
ncbi:MAG: right-handed parallel beta-helix repeat-containing protein [Pseudonocardiaceae bacterium]